MTTSVAARSPVDASRRLELPRGIASLGVLAGYAGIALLLFRQPWGDPSHRIIGGHGDAEASMWYLAWAPWPLLHGQDPLGTHQMCGPAGVTPSSHPPRRPPALPAWSAP